MFVNFEEMKKEIYKMIKKKDKKALKVLPPKSRIRGFFQQISKWNIKWPRPLRAPLPGEGTRRRAHAHSPPLYAPAHSWFKMQLRTRSWW